MFDKYMICEDTVRNVVQDGRIVGFEFGARLPYYRGLGLSMVEDIQVTVDGQSTNRNQISLTVGTRTYSLDELETEYKAVWEMGDIATVRVLKEGGLAPGERDIELMEQLRISYIPFPVQGRDRKRVLVR